MKPVLLAKGKLALQLGKEGPVTVKREILYTWHKQWPLCFPKGFAHQWLVDRKHRKLPEPHERLHPNSSPRACILTLLLPVKVVHLACLRKTSLQSVEGGNPSNTQLYRKRIDSPPSEMNIISPLLIADTGHSLNKTIWICFLIGPQFFKWGKISHWDTSLSSGAVSCLSMLYPVECYKKS